MVDKEKIILMSKLAVYDKNHEERDSKILSYFRNDYIYRQNIWVRFGVFIGCFIVILFYAMHKIVISGADTIFEFDYKAELIRIGIFVVIVMAIYSCIGTALYLRDYQKALNRSRKYFNDLDDLDGLGEKKSHSRKKPETAKKPVINMAKQAGPPNEIRDMLVYYEDRNKSIRKK